MTTANGAAARGVRRRWVRSPFPAGGRWEITPERAVWWLSHRFASLRGDSQFMRGLGPLDESEMFLLLADLDCYEGMLVRYLRGLGPRPPAPHAYLLPGREEWGRLARLLRAAIPERREEAALPELTTFSEAIVALADLGLAPSAIAALNVGDVDPERARLRGRRVPERVRWLLEGCIDELPDPGPETPLFPGKSGGRIPVAQVRRVIRGSSW